MKEYTRLKVKYARTLLVIVIVVLYCIQGLLSPDNIYILLYICMQWCTTWPFFLYK